MLSLLDQSFLKYIWPASSFEIKYTRLSLNKSQTQARGYIKNNKPSLLVPRGGSSWRPPRGRFSFILMHFGAADIDF